MKFVIILGYYNDNFDANGRIAILVAKHLIKLNNDCDLIAYSYTIDNTLNVEYQDLNITVFPLNKEIVNFRNRKDKYNGIRIGFILINAFDYIKYEKNKFFEYKNIFNYIKQHNTIKKYDFLISVTFPFEHTYNIVRKNKICKNVIYQLDPLGYHELYLSNNRNSRRNMELELFRKADYVFTTKILYNAYKNDEDYNKYINKINYINFPNITKKVLKHSDIIRIDDCSYNIVYLGAINDIYRNPKNIVTSLIDIKEKYNIDIQLYFIGNIDSKFLERRISGCEYLHVFDSISNIEAENIMNYDNVFLLNINNTFKYQTPSKIIDYISTGNPIINVIKNEFDPSIRILEKYNNHINYHEHSTSLDSLYSFLITNKSKRNSFNDVLKNYYEFTPEYAANKILDNLNNISNVI